ncbi:MAG: tRNA pseudouridine(38-40) synthase TruA [Atribacterales bacterium]
MSLRNLSLVLEYDGSRYQGWQRQSTGKTIQGIIEGVGERILQEKITLYASGRTDAGVHATGQIASFTTFNSMSVEAIKKALNSLFPSHLRVIDVLEAPLSFHPRKSAVRKIYVYVFSPSPSPVFWQPFVYSFSPRDFNLDLVKECLSLLKGTYDFISFSSSKGVGTSVRTIYSIQIEEKPRGLLRLWVEGNGFLYNMVRIIAGELWKVGMGKKKPEEIKFMLEHPSRSFNRLVLPSRGLFLMQVCYPPNFNPYQNLQLVDEGWVVPLWREKAL